MDAASAASRLEPLLAPALDRCEKLIELAVTLEREGMFQREMFLLFHRAQEQARRIEDDGADDDLAEVINRVTGWCEPREKIFIAREH